MCAPFGRYMSVARSKFVDTITSSAQPQGFCRCYCTTHMVFPNMIHIKVKSQPCFKRSQCYEHRVKRASHSKSQPPTTTSCRVSAVSRRDLLLQGCTVSYLQSALPSQALIVDESIAEAVYEAASPAVASVVNYKLVQGEPVFEGVGSGIVWDTYGHVVTNYHCISRLATDRSGTQAVQVNLVDPRDGSTTVYDAVVVGTDAYHDLAVLQVQAPTERLKPLKIGKSSEAKVGQYVYALGNPYGLSQTMTVGIVSGLNRSMPSPNGNRIYNLIQTDASINAGNSGGALLDSSGRLIGICTATYTSRNAKGRGSGVNFALPIDTVLDVVPNLIIYRSASGKR